MNTIKVDFTGDRKALHESLLRKARDSNVKFEGDENSGSFSAEGVVGRYEHASGAYIITIEKKPMLYPWAMVENSIRDLFREG